ncbi:MAG TPA: hypothetical protein VE973_00730 [Candidatus Limnocylindria bacterium]|nr:hypothetical protein [Candidatus Limnocylindria bacterium]
MGTQLPNTLKKQGYVIVRIEGVKAFSLSPLDEAPGYEWVLNDDPRNTGYVYSKELVADAIKKNLPWVTEAQLAFEAEYDPEAGKTTPKSLSIQFTFLKKGFELQLKHLVQSPIRQ